MPRGKDRQLLGENVYYKCDLHKVTDYFGPRKHANGGKAGLESLPVCLQGIWRAQGLLEQPFQKDNLISFSPCVLLGFNITGLTGGCQLTSLNELMPDLPGALVIGSAGLTKQLA